MCNSSGMASTPDFITTAEACDMLGGINRSTLKRWVDAGVITPVRKLPGDTGAYLFHLADIEHLAAEKGFLEEVRPLP